MLAWCCVQLILPSVDVGSVLQKYQFELFHVVQNLVNVLPRQAHHIDMTSKRYGA
jgi:hypothetical protein